MLAFIIALALAKPQPNYVPRADPTLYGAPILSAGVTGTLRTNGPESAGIEARLDAIVFARARLSLGPSITRAQHEGLQQTIGLPGQSPWWGRQFGLEAAWAPIPNLRLGGALTDNVSMTRAREERLQINADSRGQTTLGPIAAVGLFTASTSLHLGSGYRFPIAVKRSQTATVQTVALPPATVAEIGSPQYFFDLEGRARYQSWVASAQVSVSRTRRSRMLQDQLPPDAQQANWSDWQPSIGLGVSRLF